MAFLGEGSQFYFNVMVVEWIIGVEEWKKAGLPDDVMCYWDLSEVTAEVPIVWVVERGDEDVTACVYMDQIVEVNGTEMCWGDM